MKIKKPKNFRAALVCTLFMFWLTVVGARSAYLQIHKGSWLSDKAAGQYERELTLRGKRGAIYDRRHEAMAVSIETTSVAVNPTLLANREQAAVKLAKALHLKSSAVRKQLAGKRSFAWIKRQATPKEVAAVKKLGLPGIALLPEHSRFYPNTTLAAQVLGFTGIDGQGLEGLEFYYNEELKGEANTVKILKDALGRGFDADQWAAGQQAGQNLILTIDRQVQFIAESALAEAVTQSKARSGIALVMETQTGAMLAIAHYPFFNPNAFGRSDRKTWRNRAITDPFEPGSTMKIFSAAAALESGQSGPASIFFCENGAYVIGGHTLHDTKPHGWLSLQQIVKYSSNIGTVKVAEQLGARRLHESLHGFGFGQRTGIDFPGESSGSLSNYKRWTTVDTGAISFGQGISVTAMQLIASAGALANDGLMMQPHVVQAVTDANGRPVRTVTPKAVRQVVSAQTAVTVRRIMRSVITEGGTGVKAAVAGYEVCGKTGTAQKIDAQGKYSRELYTASFIGFAPTQRPLIAVLVVVDEPKEDVHGGSVAAPAFARIVKETMGYLNVVPSPDWEKLRVSRDVKVSG
ncbi:peptidoglycan D,D-transpeptidase FtsI family protein [Desulfatitalea tepidiphila]|uniref:peptidoglycan D,D-transpeptidase FtsI family protein n=1 Tax=Desulfatitalea tepidiphila TaxID=1185843 RepID=UPI0006B689A3|nr:penicillin-binding protein 2 [Desulfatitalea tepidiphila]